MLFLSVCSHIVYSLFESPSRMHHYTNILQQGVRYKYSATTCHVPACCNDMPCPNIPQHNVMYKYSPTACHVQIYCNKLSTTRILQQLTNAMRCQDLSSSLPLALARMSSISLLASALSSQDRDPYFFPVFFSHWDRRKAHIIGEKPNTRGQGDKSERERRA